MAADEGILFAITAMCSWGVADFFAKKAIDKIGYKTAIVLNQVVAFVPVVIFAAIFFRLPLLSPELAAVTVIAGITGILGYIFLYRGFQKGNVSIVGPITASWSVITTLIAVLLFREILAPLQILGIITVFIGVFSPPPTLQSLKQVSNGGGQREF